MAPKLLLGLIGNVRAIEQFPPSEGCGNPHHSAGRHPPSIHSLAAKMTLYLGHTVNLTTKSRLIKKA
jgi:hypothetical protein